MTPLLRLRFACPLALLAVIGCGGSSLPDDDDDGPQPDSTDWCDRIVPGAASTTPDALGLADAHFTYRYFGVAAREVADAPVSAAFSGPGATVDLDAYAHTAIDVCARAATPATLGAAAVELRNGVAWVKPGTGEVTIPDGSEAIAIDLRGLPAADDLVDALARVTTAVLDAPLARPDVEVTRYDGHPDSYFLRLSGLPASGDVYDTLVETVHQDPWPGTAAHALPIAVVTDVTMPPAAAELALAIRRANRATVIGHSVLARVAEADWRPVGTRGLAIRTRTLVDGGSPIPDQLDPDLRTDDADTTIAAASVIVPPAAVAGGPADRARARALTFYDWPAVGSIASADIKAALAVAYGTVHGFFRIYDPWHSGIDDAYLAGLAEADTAFTRRSQAHAVLDHFAASLHDAHVGVADIARDATSNEFVGVIPVDFDVIDGAPIVRSSTVAALHRGDRVLAVDGEPVDDFLAAWGARISSATPSNHAVATANFLAFFTAQQRELTLRGIDGSQRVVTIDAGTDRAPFGPQRRSGFLTNLGAPTIYYLNINGYGPPATLPQLLGYLDVARTGTGLVIDGRGYPGVNLTELLARIVGGPALSPHFGIPTWTGATTSELVDEQYTQDPPAGAAFTLPVAVLVGPWTQSAAENVVMLMMQRPDLITVGRQTSGSNGNITSVMLPGGYGMSFTGMQIRFADGSPFHGIGIPLTRESHPTVQDLADGIDRELTDAIAAVTGG